jgi:hypothetical protein
MNGILAANCPQLMDRTNTSKQKVVATPSAVEATISPLAGMPVQDVVQFIQGGPSAKGKQRVDR